jgi:hypothetical protein
MTPRLAAAEELASSQAGVLSRSQLAAIQVSASSVHAAVRSRRWRIVGRAVVVHRQPLDRESRWWVAVIHAGPRSLLCAWSAAEAQGLQHFTRETVHVVVPIGTRVHALPWMKVHVSRRLRPDDVHAARLPPQVRPARALVDTAAWSETSRAACAVLAAGVQQRLVTPQQLWVELERAGKVARHRLLAGVIHDIDGGSHALAELDLVKLCRAYGLPEPLRQQVRRDAKGKRRYLDAWWRRADGRVVHLEVDGSIHLEPDHWWDDMDRQSDLTIAEDALVLRVASLALRAEPFEVAQRIARALGVPLRFVSRPAA